MKVKNLNEAVVHYSKKNLPQLPNKIERIRSKETYLDYILAGRPKAAKIAFREAELRIIARLDQCESAEEISGICYNTFGKIPGIGEQTISDYIYHALFIRDINPESNCISLLTTTARKKLSNHGYIKKNTIILGEEKSLLNGFDTYAIVDFANKHHQSFKQEK